MHNPIHSTHRAGSSPGPSTPPGACRGGGAGHKFIGLLLGASAALAVFGLAELVHHSGGNPFEIGETK